MPPFVFWWRKLQTVLRRHQFRVKREVSRVEGLKMEQRRNSLPEVFISGTEREPLPLVAPVLCHCSISSSSFWPVSRGSVTFASPCSAMKPSNLAFSSLQGCGRNSQSEWLVKSNYFDNTKQGSQIRIQSRNKSLTAIICRCGAAESPCEMCDSWGSFIKLPVRSTPHAQLRVTQIFLREVSSNKWKPMPPVHPYKSLFFYYLNQREAVILWTWENKNRTKKRM